MDVAVWKVNFSQLVGEVGMRMEICGSRTLCLHPADFWLRF